MKLQSSIEFLTTYSFLFLLIGIIISFLFFFSTAPRAVIPGQCISLSGPACLSVQDYVNGSQHYSLLTFSFSNAQPVPINVLGMSVLINTANSIASGCIPTVEYPGGTFTCVAAMAQTPSSGTIVTGFYTINTLYCNSGISSLQNNCTTGSNIQYSGSFSTQVTTTKPLLFSVLTLLGPQNQQLPSLPTNPLAIPTGFTRVQNGGWATVSSSYGFGSSAFQGNSFLGVRVSPFTLSTSALSNNNVACSANYNSLISMAYSIVYLPSGTTGTGGVSVYANNAIEFYHASNNLVWGNVFGGAGWHGNFGANTYGPSSVTFNSGINYLAVIWGHDCGPGVQVVNVAGLPGTASTTSSTSTSSTSSTSTSVTTTTSTSSTSSTSLTTTSSTTSTSSTSTTSTSSTSTTSTTISYIYCVGGNTYTNAVYSTSTSSTGVGGSWTSTNSYPISLNQHSCVNSGGYIYCTGGYTGSRTSLSYYASISGTTVGSWSSTTAYPVADAALICTAQNSRIYCLTGDASPITALAYTAPLSGTGIGTWVAANSYPLAVEYLSCASTSGDIYCMGGSTGSFQSAAYYAPLVGSTIGAWTATTAYPTTIDAHACSISGGYIYCVAGFAAGTRTTNVYYAAVSGTGIGAWSAGTSYPLAVGFYTNDCALANGKLYCVGGDNAGPGITNVYYAAASGSVGAWSATTSYPIGVYAQSCTYS